jgi:DNA-binding transcriptional ArsR family regulator
MRQKFMLPDNLTKKAYTLAYATFRLAASLANPAIRHTLEESCLTLLTAALKSDVAGSKNAATVLEYLLALMRDTGMVHVQSAELVFGEIEHFKKELESIPSQKEAPVISKEEIFPADSNGKNPSIFTAVWSEENYGKESGNSNATDLNPAIAALAQGPTIIPPQVSEESFVTRKEKILQRIRQSGNCRMKDLQEILKDTSERTLRYDLQRLVQEGSVERVGPGGPATYYRIRT